MVKKVVITGASGLIGMRLTRLLTQHGYDLHLLGRNKIPVSVSGVKSFTWDIEKGEVDKVAFEGVTAIIHLAGAGVAEQRWTEGRRKEIVDSRVNSAQMIYEFLKSGKHEVGTYISASAVGYYGDCGEEWLSEERKPGKGFLAEVCKQWEQSAMQMTGLGIREVRCRIGIVLAKNGGTLPELTKTLPFGIASWFAKKNLYYPWVHIDDVCGIMLYALENKNVSGAYNTTAPIPLLMKELMKEIVNAKSAHALLLPAPTLAIRLALGEMSEMLLGSQRCRAEKIISTGYQFKFGEIQKALKNLDL